MKPLHVELLVALRRPRRHRRRGGRARSRPDQYDAGRLAQHVAEAHAHARAAAIRRHRRDHGDNLGDGPLAAGYFAGTARIYSTFSFFFAATLTAFFFTFFLAAERSVACDACAPQARAAAGAKASAAATAMTVSRIMVWPPVSRRRTGAD